MSVTVISRCAPLFVVELSGPRTADRRVTVAGAPHPGAVAREVRPPNTKPRQGRWQGSIEPERAPGRGSSGAQSTRLDARSHSMPCQRHVSVSLVPRYGL